MSTDIKSKKEGGVVRDTYMQQQWKQVRGRDHHMKKGRDFKANLGPYSIDVASPNEPQGHPCDIRHTNNVMALSYKEYIKLSSFCSL